MSRNINQTRFKRRAAILLKGGILVGLLGAVLLPAPAPADVHLQNADTVICDKRTSAVIHGALKYLAMHQSPSGAIAPNGFQAAYTGYALMAFMASGYLPKQGEFGDTVANATNFLLKCARPDGFIGGPYGGNNMYGHGICTTALAEVYGETRDPAIRPKLESAVQLIIDCQGSSGGWRYAPKVNPDADISVTVLQLVALRAAKNDGLNVPQSTIDKAITYVKSCHRPGGGFAYQPGGEPGFARTAAAIYSLQVCGSYDDPYIRPASEYLMQTFASNTQYFSYGNFYAALAQYMVGGETWARWYHMIHERLMSRVHTEPDGTCYWDVQPGDMPDAPTYTTSVAAMILALPDHYLPLYQR